MNEQPTTDAALETASCPCYLDFNATTPVDIRVAEEVMRYMVLEFGNAGSRTHSFGQAAKKRVNEAREQVAAVAAARPDEIIFTSGATESDNLAILGLADCGRQQGKRHIISTAIEHKAVLEPLQVLQAQGFDVDLVCPTEGGWVRAEDIAARLRPDTLLVSVMAVNNETGVEQPIMEIADILSDHPAYFHVDAAQAVGKLGQVLMTPRIDLMAVSGHKISAPKGIGALLTRRRDFRRPPLKPLMYGGGQEHGLRPGTLPVPLIAGLGLAAFIAEQELTDRMAACRRIKTELLDALAPLHPILNGDPERTVPSSLNFSIPGVDAEAAIVALKDLAAVSNGSACTSQTHEPSHVLTAAGLPMDRIEGALRFSWGPTVQDLPATIIRDRLAALIH
jgi:cysteine desulfurase